MTARRALHLSLAVLGAAVLTACASGTGDVRDQGFVSGDGMISVVAPAERVAAPRITGLTLDGTVFDSVQYAGKVIVINVWASWCAPCRAEAPSLERVARDLADNGVQFVGLNVRDSPTTAQGFVDTFDISYPNVVDRDGRLQLLFGDSLPPQAIPSTLVVDQQGRVAARGLGKLSESSLRGLIEPLLPP